MKKKDWEIISHKFEAHKINSFKVIKAQNSMINFAQKFNAVQLRAEFWHISAMLFANLIAALL